MPLSQEMPAGSQPVGVVAPPRGGLVWALSLVFGARYLFACPDPSFTPSRVKREEEEDKDIYDDGPLSLSSQPLNFPVTFPVSHGLTEAFRAPVLQPHAPNNNNLL